MILHSKALSAIFVMVSGFASGAATLGEQEHRDTPAPAVAFQQDSLRGTATSGPTVWRADEAPLDGGLWGRKINVEAGHGRVWTNSGWGWQREDWFPGVGVHSSQEDFNTARMVNRWFLPYLRNAGARVYTGRCPDEQVNEVICEFDSGINAPHTSTGSWLNASTSHARNGSYIYAASNTSGATANMQVRATIPESGYYGVTIWYPLYGFAAPDARFTVVDAAGYQHTFLVDQNRDGGQWVWLDRFYFEAGTDVLVMEVSNQSSLSGRQIMVDAVRLGGGMGSETFGGGTSGVPRWQETATCWTKYNGAPTWVWQANLNQVHDYSVRFNYASYTQSELLLRLHTNGSVYHTGYGSEVYQNAPDSESLIRAGYIYPKIIQAIRAHYRSTWTNRGVKGNFQPSGYSFVSILLELGFHDWLTDAQALMDADFRRVAMRGFYEGTVDFFSNKTGVYMPEPPENIALVCGENLSVQAQWTTPTIGPSPESYRVYYSKHPHCYKDYVEVAAPATVVEISSLDPNEVYYFQVRSANAGGLSLQSETLAAMVSDASDARKVLLVNGFDRLDWDIDETDNHRNYCIQHATAIADAASSMGITVSIDSSSNEAVAFGELDLASYALVNWMLGQESISDETFSAAEQLAIEAYRQRAGVLLVTGANIGVDLGTNGTSQDQAFLTEILGVTYFDVRINNVSTLTADNFSIFDGLDLQVNSSSSVYNLLGVDAIRTTAYPFEPPTEISYRHSGGIVGVYSTEQPHPLFTFTVPLEVIDGADARRSLMERILPHMPDIAGVNQWSLY